MAYTIETLPSGSKRIRINYTDEFGAYKRKSITAKTEKEVMRKAVAFENNIQHLSDREGITVGEAVEEYILLKQHTLSPSTISSYKGLLRSNFDTIRDTLVGRLTDRNVQMWINELAVQGLSPKTISNAYGLFLPSIKKYTKFVPTISLPQKEKYIHDYPQDYEVEKIVAEAKGTVIELPIILAAFGGMRMSEILGLKWSDIKSDHIVVQRARVYVNGDYVDKTTKSVSGTRMLPIFTPIRSALARAAKKSEYIVPMTAASIKRRYNTLLKHLGLPAYRFHDLRHHSASVGAKLGIPDDYMRQYIGHSTVNMLKRYQHQMESATSNFAKVLDKYYTEQTDDE